MAILWFLVMTVLGAWVLSRTKVGNWVFAVGGNKDAARMVGVPANATKIGLFITVAVCGWVHGMVVLFQTSRSNVIEGVGQEFYFIIAAVLGGCLLTGGFGSVVGAALGCLILGMTAAGHSPRRLGQQPLLPVPRCDPARRGVLQRGDPPLGAHGVTPGGTASADAVGTGRRRRRS